MNKNGNKTVFLLSIKSEGELSVDKKNELIILNEETIKNKVYTIRGEQVMLDFELAEIYGYSTKRFNEQIKNNIEKFKGFIFRLTWDEADEFSWSKKSTLNKNGDKRGYNLKYLPYAFTESGIYMLMTVLKGPLAIEQSRKLINIFKGMKDFLFKTNQLTIIDNVISLVSKVNNQEKRIELVENRLDVVMDNFIDPAKYKEFHILDGERIESQEVYKTIFGLAKKSIFIFDNYISSRTLKYLKVCSPNIMLVIVSDNISKDGINEEDIEIFKNETGIVLSLVKGHGRLHDRYIVIDYDTPQELIYHSGSSIKDTGNKIATITKIEDTFILDNVIEEFIPH